jgi:chaperonin GroEL
MYREGKFDVEARDGLKAGVDKLANAVKVTLGPKGKIVVFKDPYTGIHATKDGVTVAENVKLEDNLERMGADIVMEAASKTAELAGDGTTSSTVLAQAMVTEGLKNVAAGANPMDLKRGMDRALDFVKDRIDELSIPVEDNDKLRHVATISANNDPIIGELIASAFDVVGKDGVITVEEAQGTATEIDVVKGLQFDRGYLSPYFVTDKDAMQVEYENVKVVICEDKVETLMDVQAVIKISQSDPVLLICDDITNDALSGLVMAKLRSSCKIVAIKTPFIGKKKTETLEDIAKLTGAYVISKKKGHALARITSQMVGGVERCLINKSTTVLVNGKAKEEDVKSHIVQLEKYVNEQDSEFEKRRAEERVARLKGGVAVLYVGAATETERKEKKDRIDDSLAATRAALEEGIVPGGGVALLRASSDLVSNWKHANRDQEIGFNIVLDSCKATIKQIASNSGLSGDVIINEILSVKDDTVFGYDFKTDEYVDMIETGIIDPTKVVRVSLENAISVASMIIMTECALVNLGDDEEGLPQFMK